MQSPLAETSSRRWAIECGSVISGGIGEIDEVLLIFPCFVGYGAVDHRVS
jgi:hypothetical protein